MSKGADIGALTATVAGHHHNAHIESSIQQVV